ncbi:TetR/AcrR family transcriptional regulator, partial [Acinetobacter baumannii]|uniref:TetR/AcrR family transcriptional regulator n=1 Tax=Acinetobacter baumannii TaxID=470 RepID=UPI00189AFAB9
SMRGLASRSGISVGGLYRYFHNKRFLAAQVFRRATEREVAAVAVAVTEGADVHERLSHAVQQFVRRAQAAPKLAWALIAEPVAPEVDAERLRYRAAYSRLYRRMLEKGVASGELPPQSTSLSAAALVGAIAEALVGPLA